MIQSVFYFGNQEVPVIATAIHNGHLIPHQLLSYTALSADARFHEEDPFTGIIAELFDNHIILETSRFANDLNRTREKSLYLKPEDAWGLEVRNAELPEELKLALYQSYDSWYKVLDIQVERMLAKHPFLIVFDLHSYNHRRGGPAAPPDCQWQNPDIILGRSNMPHKYHPLVQELADSLNGKIIRDRSLDVRCDVKFPGGNFPRHLHRNFDGRVMAIAVEFKKIFMDEHTNEVYPLFFGELKDLFLKEAMPWAERVLGQIAVE